MQVFVPNEHIQSLLLELAPAAIQNDVQCIREAKQWLAFRGKGASLETVPARISAFQSRLSNDASWVVRMIGET
eukprot:1224392-Pyramimonas_sp.AAC.1